MGSEPKGVGGLDRIGGCADGKERLGGRDGTSAHEIVSGGLNGESAKNTR